MKRIFKAIVIWACTWRHTAKRDFSNLEAWFE